jgi:YrbI family 3-deoxy-D-manno-octulosonate 8-phosphate phosphatase
MMVYNQLKRGTMVKEITEESLLNKIRKVKLLILDVDGVLTDGRIVIDDAGLESKQFDVRDGHGLKILMRFGIDVVLLTGRRSRVVEHRAADLGITEVHQGILNKAEAFAEILKRRDLSPEAAACVGGPEDRRLCDATRGRTGGRSGGVRGDSKGAEPMGGCGREI